MKAHYCRGSESGNRGLGRVFGGFSLLLLSVLCLASFEKFGGDGVCIVSAINQKISEKHRSEDDEDELNVDPNMAQGEN